LQSSPAVELWDTIAAEAARESALWAAALRPPAEQERESVFSPLLLGDYLYAHGLVRIAVHGEVTAVVDLAELVSLCAYLRAEGAEGDGPLWAATAALIGAGELAAAREALRGESDPAPLLELARTAAGPTAVERALEAHARRFG